MQFFNILLARINLIIIGLLGIVYFLKRTVRKHQLKGTLHSITGVLRRYHKVMGLIAITLGFIHGLLSSDYIYTLNLGTFSWIILLLLWASWYFRSRISGRGWIFYHLVLSVLLFGTVLLHVGEVTDKLELFPSRKPIQDSPNLSTSPQNTADFKYKDGVYSGKAMGYRPDLVVQVTITDGKISSVSIVSHNEKGIDHYGLPMKKIPEEIIKKQTTVVDGVAGATRTSNGIKNAVNDALSQAVVQ